MRSMSMSQINTLPPEVIKGDMEQALNLKRTHFEFKHRKADGSVVDVEVFSSRVPFGDKIYLHSIVHDITEKRHLQNQLLQALKMESIGRLAGGVAHDFNNMLSVILGHAEISLGQVEKTNPLYENLQQIMLAAERSANLTRQLLAFARKQTVSPQVLNLNETVAGMLKMLRRLIGEDVDLEWKPAANLSDIMIDPTQIDQILANLCVNSRDAISDNGRVIIETANTSFDEAFCDAHPGCNPGEFVSISVADTGCGMDQDTLTRIFEPFFTTKEVGKGTGLGLPTVYGIVKQNNGFVDVVSEPGAGTKFTIYFPKYIGKSEIIREVAATNNPVRGQETILLVEDEVSILKMTKLMLERMGYKVIASSTPGEAIRLAGEHAGEIHLLITDVVMPEMNGRDLAKSLLSLYPGLKRLFMSGYTADVIAHHGVLGPGIHFIQKPFSAKSLASKVREVLDID